MSRLSDSLYHVRLLDDLARKGTGIHRLHPLAKALTTLVYLVTVISFDRRAVGDLIPFILFPILVLTWADLPAAPILNRLLLAEPFIIGIGILNPLLDRQPVSLAGFSIASGWLTFFSILAKSSLTVAASILLIATTGIERLAAALRQMGVPRIFVLQLVLTYRYISVLIEEAARMMRAHSLRAPGRKGLSRALWGPFAGQLLLRAYDRAQRVYQAMSLRGFDGEYRTGRQAAFALADTAWLLGWSAFFVFARLFSLPTLLGNLITGAFGT